MTSENQSWTISHFSRSNPAGRDQDDVPALLRRVADSIERLGQIRVQDIVFHGDEITDDGFWPSMTVYYGAIEPD